MRADWREASVRGDSATVARLLAEGADINARDRFGQTALMLVARHGHTALARILLQHGADTDLTAKYNLSALMLAIINHHCEIARLLIDAGADMSIRGSGSPGFAGLAARDLAEREGMRELASRICCSDR